jgi:hypothetical protein
MTLPYRIDGRSRGIDYANVRSQLEAGARVCDLAELYAVSRSAISQGAARAGWTGHQDRSAMRACKPHCDAKIPGDIRPSILARIRAGVTQRAIAAEFGVSRPYICKIVRQASMAP